MIEIDRDRSTAGCIVVRCGGSIQGAEYDAFLDEFDKAAGRFGGNLSAVFVIESPPSYGDSDAFKDDLHFGTHEYRELRRAAYVGDVEWVEALVRAFGWLTRTEERVFAASQLDAALAWASESPA